MAKVGRVVRIALIILLLIATFGVGWLAGRIGVGSVVDPASLPDVERRFVDQMRDASLVGQFTVDGPDNRAPRPDRYEIASVEKVGEDRWRFNARLGDRLGGATIPIVVPMRWVGDNPMIAITDFTIPSLGTFTARVFFHGDRYVGTWQHGEAGGHMFGRIEKAGTAQGEK